MYIKSCHFSLMTLVGVLTQSQVENLKHALQEYPEIKRTGQTITFQRGSSMLIVQPDLIAFAIQGEDSEIDIEHIYNELIKLKDLLGVSSSSNIQINLEAIENSSENIMEKSKVPISEAVKALNAEGIGYRFMLNYDEFKGNARIEPYIEDKQKIYYHINLYSENSYQNEDIKVIFSQMFTLGTNNLSKAAKKIFS